MYSLLALVWVAIEVLSKSYFRGLICAFRAVFDDAGDGFADITSYNWKVVTPQFPKML